MSISQKLALDLEELPMDVSDLVGSELTVESLTAGHGMDEYGASCSFACSSCCACSV